MAGAPDGAAAPHQCACARSALLQAGERLSGADAPRSAQALPLQRLRTLTIDPRAHPRGRAHLSAASGLVCAFGRAYVVCDDEHHLAVFGDTHRPGTLHRLLPGDLPADPVARKRRKADFEALLLLDHFPAAGRHSLVAFSSGSTPQRWTGVALALDEQGRPTDEARRFDLAPLYRPLMGTLGELNIEGAFMQGDELVLLHRGGQGGADNTVLRLARTQLVAAIEGRADRGAPPRVQPMHLGHLDGVPLGFTDGAAVVGEGGGGSWVFCAAAEDTASSYADGPCRGGVVGLVSHDGTLLALHRLALPLKPEGIAAHALDGCIELCLVTDADDPARHAELLYTRLVNAPAGVRT